MTLRTYKNIKNELINLIVEGLATSMPDLNVEIENVPHSSWKTADQDEWVRISIRENSQVRQTNDITSAIFVNFGIIAIQIFTKVDKGTNTQADILQAIMDITYNYDNNSLRIEQPSLSNDIVSDGWKQINIDINYEWDYYFTEGV